jgi:hypothetical protein
MWEFVGLGCWVWMGDVRFFGLVGGGGGTSNRGRGRSCMKTLVSLKRLFSLKSYFEDSE